MAFKINLTLYTILLLWTSVSGKLYPFSGNWSVEAETCANDGSKTDEKNFDIGVLDLANVSYDALNDETVVKAEGKLGARTETAGPNMNTSLILNNYHYKDDSKEYSARLWVTGGIGGQTQQAYVEPSVSIYGNGTVKLRLLAFVDSQQSPGCAEAKSILSQVSIDA